MLDYLWSLKMKKTIKELLYKFKQYLTKSLCQYNEHSCKSVTSWLLRKTSFCFFFCGVTIK